MASKSVDSLIPRLITARPAPSEMADTISGSNKQLLRVPVCSRYTDKSEVHVSVSAVAFANRSSGPNHGAWLCLQGWMLSLLYHE